MEFKGMHQAAVKPEGQLILSSLVAFFLAFGGPQVGMAAPSAAEPLTIAESRVLHEGSQLWLNGRTYAAAWSQWRDRADPTVIRTGISDAGLAQRLGIELLDTAQVGQQPIQWFSHLATPLKTRLSSSGQYRYLDISDLAQQVNWQLQAAGNTLQLIAPTASIQSIRQGQQPWGARIVIDLDRPASWQITRLTNS
ncbi:MAG TPA: hypothetical protein V6D03_16335, partial [Candidatus Caenarcaniphilales bacterium]